jgi:predicted phage terminase large subunit-like protein
MMKLSPAEYRTLTRHDFYTFMHRAFRELNPRVPFFHNWHIELVAAKLHACFEGEITRLIINVPPRSLKSHAAAVSFPAYVLGHNPSAPIICASYGQDLANKHSMDCRTLMASEWYRAIFPTRLSPQKQSVQEFLTTQNGFRLATSVGGVLTGRGADFIIIDDPLKPDEALSETQRGAVNEWFDHTLYSRLNDKRTGCIVIIMQRLHEDDLVGHVLEQEDWDLVRLPAIAEEDENHIIVSPYRTCTVRRRMGEALHPDREPLEVLEHLRRTLGEYNFAGQYQQQPAPLGGGLVKTEWFKAYVPGEEPAKFDRIVQSWDTANKSTELSDFSVCTTWGQKNKKLYLLHVLRRRMDYPDLKRAVGEQAERFSPTNILIEDKASGTQLIQELIRDGVYGVTRYEPTMEKIMRLHSVTNTIENGFVYLPTEADWLATYLHELTTFPSGKHDDQADSTSQALDWMKQTTHTHGVLEYYRQEVLRERLGLHSDYRFLQYDDDEEIVAVHKTTGQKIRWTGRAWVDVGSNDGMVPQETCPACHSKCVGTYGDRHRCNQCGNQWPAAPSIQQGPTRRDVLNGIVRSAPTRIISWR